MSWGEMPTTQSNATTQRGLERQVPALQVERAQQPTTPERPKSPLSVAETIKQEAEQARALSKGVEAQAAANQVRLANVDARFNRLGQSTDRPADVQAEYTAALRERDAIATAQAHYLAEKARLDAEYQPFQQHASAIEGLKENATTIATSERRLTELSQENTALYDRLTAFETSSAARVAELQAEQQRLQQESQQLQQEQARREAEYRQAINDRIEWCAQREMYLPLAMNQDGSVKPEYQPFLQQYSEMKGWINQAEAYIGEPKASAESTARSEAIAKELGNIEAYRNGLKSALDANVADITSTEQTLNQAQANYQKADQAQAEAIPRVQANIANRQQGRAQPLSHPQTGQAQPTWN